MDGRPARTLLAIIAWVIAGFIILNNIIFEKPLEEWWLPLLLVVVGLILALYPGRRESGEADVAVAVDAPAAALQPVTASALDSGAEVNLAAAIEAAVSDAPIAEAEAPEAESVAAESASVDPVSVESDPVRSLDDAPEVRASVVGSPEEQHRISGGEDTPVIDAAEAPSIVGFSTLIDGAEAVEENAGIESPPTDADPESTPEEATTVSDEPEPEPVIDETPAEPVADEAVEVSEPESAPAVEAVAPGLGDDDETEQLPLHTEAVESVEAEPEAVEPVAVEKSAAPRRKKAESASTGPDDLTKIEGIGPKMSKALTSAGIDTFAKLSESSEDQLREAIAAAGMRFAPSIPTWAEQAAYAAKGDWEGLQTFQDQLVAGRRPS